MLSKSIEGLLHYLLLLNNNNESVNSPTVLYYRSEDRPSFKNMFEINSSISNLILMMWCYCED